MIRSSMQLATLLAALVAGWQPSIARAQDEDVQLWLITSVTGDLDDDTRLTIDASQRWREQTAGDEQQTLRLVVDQELDEAVLLGGGIAVFQAGSLTEFRLDQQLTVLQGRFAFRTRIEERFFEGADHVELRLRQRVLYNQPLGRDLRATVHGEWFGLLQPRTRGAPSGTEQWRAQLSVIHSLRRDLDVGAGYLFIFAPRGPLTDRISHVQQITITYRF